MRAKNSAVKIYELSEKQQFLRERKFRSIVSNFHVFILHQNRCISKIMLCALLLTCEPTKWNRTHRIDTRFTVYRDCCSNLMDVTWNCISHRKHKINTHNMTMNMLIAHFGSHTKTNFWIQFHVLLHRKKIESKINKELLGAKRRTVSINNLVILMLLSVHLIFDQGLIQRLSLIYGKKQSL